MKGIRFFLCFAALIFCLENLAKAQAPLFTDFKPEYKKWKDIYILDKITYTDTKTIFHFRFIDLDGGAASFYGPGGEFAWLLKNVDKQNEVFTLVEIRNITINGILQKGFLAKPEAIEYYSNPGDIFTCEVHFPRLPSHVKKVHFIEGQGREMFENHFNCFNVVMKTFDSKNLGDEDDMEEVIEKFEKQFEKPPVSVPEIEISEAEKEAIFADRFLELVNQLRLEGCYCGSVARGTAPPVVWHPSLAKASKGFVEEMWKLNTMLSTDTAGRTPLDRVKSLGINARQAYENISFGFTNIEDAFKGWRDSPQQCLRMMNPNVKAIGAARKGKYWSMVLITE